MTLPGILKTKLLLARYDRQAVVAFALVGVLAFGAAGWLVLSPGTTEVVEQEHEQHVEAKIGSSAIVTGESSVWEPDTVLRDKPVYLTSATPKVSLRSVVDVPSESDVEVTHRISLIYRVERSGDVVWRSRKLLLADTSRPINGTATATTTVNLTQLQNRAAEIANEFSSVGSVSMRLALNVDYETDRYEGSLNATGPVAFTDRAVAIDQYPSAERTRYTESTITKQAPRDWGTIGVLFAIVLASVLGGAWTRRIQEEDVDTEAIEEELTKRRYEEWISGGRLPTTTFERAIEIRSLAELVDLAIDSNKRVVDDAEREVYGVIDGTTVYYYVDGAVTPGFLKAVETPEVAADTAGLDAEHKTDDGSEETSWHRLDDESAEETASGSNDAAPGEPATADAGEPGEAIADEPGETAPEDPDEASAAEPAEPSPGESADSFPEKFAEAFVDESADVPPEDPGTDSVGPPGADADDPDGGFADSSDNADEDPDDGFAGSPGTESWDTADGTAESSVATDDDSTDVAVGERSEADAEDPGDGIDETGTSEAPEDPFVRAFIDEIGEEEADTIGSEETNVTDDDPNGEDGERDAVEDPETDMGGERDAAGADETDPVEEERARDHPEESLDQFVSESDEGDDESGSAEVETKTSADGESIEDSSVAND